MLMIIVFFFFSSRRRHTRSLRDWSSDVCSSDLGRFRSFLLTSFKHFAANEHDRGRAQERGGGERPLSLDFKPVEARYAAEPSDTLTPEALFERQWALGVLDRVLATLRGECVDAGKEAIFDRVKDIVI